MDNQIKPLPPCPMNEDFLQQQAKFRAEMDEICGIPEGILNPEPVWGKGMAEKVLAYRVAQDKMNRIFRQRAVDVLCPGKGGNYG